MSGFQPAPAASARCANAPLRPSSASNAITATITGSESGIARSEIISCRPAKPRKLSSASAKGTASSNDNNSDRNACKSVNMVTRLASAMPAAHSPPHPAVTVETSAMVTASPIRPSAASPANCRASRRLFGILPVNCPSLSAILRSRLCGCRKPASPNKAGSWPASPAGQTPH